MERMSADPRPDVAARAHRLPPAGRDRSVPRADSVGMSAIEISRLQSLLGNTAVSALLNVQRAPVIEDDLRLESSRFASNDRLQRAFHNNPTLTTRDHKEPIRLMQEALVAAGLPMPRSTKLDNSLDGIWGPETTATVRRFQDHAGVRPMGGFEAGRKTLGALDGAPQKQRVITRDQFIQTLRRTWGVPTVREGTFDEQAQGVNTRTDGQGHSIVRKPLTRDMWQPFPLPDQSTLYADILDAFDQMAAVMGGVAQVTELVFFDTGWDVDASGTVVRAPGEGASFGAGQLTIFHTATRGNLIPSRRSGARGESELRDPDARDATLHNIIHEMGHGVAEIALGPDGISGVDPHVFDEYKRQVGWFHDKLWDIGKRKVAKALDEGHEPPATQQITQDNWNAARWVEQPLSSYMTIHPSEDLPEAISFYVTLPRLLKARSPRRFAFVEAHKSLWSAGLRARGPGPTP